MAPDHAQATSALRPGIGASLVQFRLGYALHLEFDTADELEFTIETGLSIVCAGTAYSGEPVTGACADALIPWIRSPMRDVRVADGGRLQLALGEATLTVEPHPDYEAWQARTESGLLIVCLPGGGTANWLPAESDWSLAARASVRIALQIVRALRRRHVSAFRAGAGPPYVKIRRMTAWRDSASQMSQDELDGLLNFVLPLAEELLGKNGEFFPFGALLSHQGEPSLIAADPGLGEHPPSVQVLTHLYDGARTNAASERAVAFVADVRVEDSDAVRVELEHEEGVALVVLLPYARSRFKKSLTFGRMRVAEGRPRVWNG